MTTLPILPSIAPLAESSDLWLVDIWGVMHNGVRPYAASVSACQAFRGQGGTVLLVTNAPRPRESVAGQLGRIGVAETAYDGIISSGDVSRNLIGRWAGRGILHIGPERDVPVFAGLEVRTGATIEDAEAVVCTGLYDDETETPADYDDLLAKLISRKLPMICANPDQTVERGGKIVYCAGAIARSYQARGGTVSYAGKPYGPIYEQALALGASLRGAPISKNRVLAIGDGITTDIAGAGRFGIRSVYVASPVHVNENEPLSAAAARLFAERAGERPIAIMSAFAW